MKADSHDFKVNWEKPEDANMFWVQGKGLYPEPVTPLDFSIVIQSTCHGYNKGFEYYQYPLSFVYRHINTYVYSGIPPFGNNEKRDIDVKKSVEKVKSVMPSIGELWKAEWLPELKDQIAWWDAFDLKGASDSKLAEHLKKTIEKVKRAWEIHYILMIPMRLAIHLFDEMYNELFPEKNGVGAYELLGGRHILIEAEEKLWELSRKAIEADEVKKALLSSDSYQDIFSTLKNTSAGADFLKSFQNYLKDYGKQSYLYLISKPFDIEDPRQIILLLKNYMTLSDKNSPKAKFEKSEKAKEVCLKNIREQLSVFPKPVISEFESLLKSAQAGYPLMTEHTYWIESMTTFRAREVALEIGNRFVKNGSIKTKEDIFYLTKEELQQAAEKLPESINLKNIIDKRKSLEQHFSKSSPPLTIGTSSLPPMANDPIILSSFKSSGSIASFLSTPDADAKKFTGQPASAGSVIGTAKIILDLEEAHKLKSGDILIAKYTLPAWTNLFAIAKGLVTDCGGILSHSAIVAREYGIPAVVGTSIATKAIKDGQTIKVDGSKGTVTII